MPLPIFFGREDLLEEVFRWLSKPTPQSCSVVGQRKIGKTSFLKHLRRPSTLRRYGLQPEDYFFVYFNFEGLGQADLTDHARRLAGEVHREARRRGKAHILPDIPRDRDLYEYADLLSEAFDDLRGEGLRCVTSTTSSPCPSSPLPRRRRAT